MLGMGEVVERDSISLAFEMAKPGFFLKKLRICDQSVTYFVL